MFQLQPDQIQFFYIDFDGSCVSFTANTFADACSYVQYRFRGRGKAYFYVWHPKHLFEDNFKIKKEEKIKEDIKEEIKEERISI